ncbi:MAG: hypothetical protein EZS28_008752 [Streblomastix strix]|uniref:Uncharacterized protein n=1 Tax=Streblomastix strix TaxID=222440 RepID=A0A5J4WLI5_9EUKA|nr:MAG: hypothetical protein EZS28_008752 [Streblomastix strix]
MKQKKEELQLEEHYLIEEFECFQFRRGIKIGRQNDSILFIANDAYLLEDPTKVDYKSALLLQVIGVDKLYSNLLKLNDAYLLEAPTKGGRRSPLEFVI